MFNIGLDVSKETIDVAIPKLRKNEIVGFEARRISNHPKGFAILEEDLKKIEKKYKLYEKIRLVCETTGIYSFPVMDYFSRLGFHCNEVHAFSIKRHKQGIMSKNKTDKADARDIVDYAYRYSDKLAQPYVSRSPELVELGMLLSMYKNLEKGNKQLLGVQEAYSFVSDKVPFQFTKSEKALDFLVENHQKYAKNFHKGILDYCHQHFAETSANLLTIKGVGDKLLPYLIHYTQDFRRFKNARDFTSYCGLVPNYFQSGTSVNGKPRIAHKTMCNSELRSKITQSANIAMRHNHQIKALVSRLSHFTFKQQLIAASRKLAVQIHYIGLNKVCYDPKA